MASLNAAVAYFCCTICDETECLVGEIMVVSRARTTVVVRFIFYKAIVEN